MHSASPTAWLRASRCCGWARRAWRARRHRWLTQGYDNARTGANLAETILTPANVTPATFGRLFSLAVDEEVFAQPLYVPGLTINGVVHNTLFVATSGNSVYAFDADDAAQSATPLWQQHLATPIPPSKYGFSTANTGLGIVGTPVIDPLSNTLYVVSTAWDTPSQTASQRLHALDITTGAEKFGGPVNIAAAGFNADSNLQRPGLLLLNGTIYIAFGSHGDMTYNVANQQPEGYSGLVLAYDAATLTLKSGYNAAPGGVGAAFWQSARGLASDGTYIYGMTANGSTKTKIDYSESFVRLDQNLNLVDYFQDPNAACLNKLDLDLSSSGPLIMPGHGTNILVGGGKQGKEFLLLLNRTLNTQHPQHFWGTVNYIKLPAEGGACADPRPDEHGWLTTTAFWNRADAPVLYIWGSYDDLLSYQLNSTNTVQYLSYNILPNGWPNALAVSANGNSNGIVWVVTPNGGQTILSAFNATTANKHLAKLWDSTMAGGRDALGALGRYSVPTVANGRVYVGSGSNQVYVYGLLGSAPSFQITAQAPSLMLNAGLPGRRSESVALHRLNGFTGPVSLAVTGGLPAGATATIAPPILTSETSATLTLDLTNAALPLQNTYTIIVGASGGGVTGSVPIRLTTRVAYIVSPRKVSCDDGKMAATLPVESFGMSDQGLWVQDSAAPVFPGRFWTSVQARPGIQTQTTGNWIADRAHRSFHWVFDDSNGAPATFDNAFRVANLASIYDCP